MQRLQKVQRMQRMQKIERMQLMQKIEKSKERKVCKGCQDCLNWNRKTSQNVQNLGLFEKNMGFSEKTYFFKFTKIGKIAVEWVSNSIVSKK